MTSTNLLVPYEGKAKTPSKIYVPYEGKAKQVIKCYASQNGVAKLVFPREDEPLYFEILVDNLQTATTARVGNQWKNTLTVVNTTQNQTYTIPAEQPFYLDIPVAQGDVLKCTLPQADDFRIWQGSPYADSIPFVQLRDSSGRVQGATVALTAMPPMAKLTLETSRGGPGSGTSTHFFAFFNCNGSIASLPEGSFDTSAIIYPGWRFFSDFNRNGALTSLPEGSFNTTAMTGLYGSDYDATCYYFFSRFNSNGALTSLPAGSFNFSNVTELGSYCFDSFAAHSQLASLPAGSFNFNKLTKVGDSFCEYFNSHGVLTSLPAGSFNISNVTAAGKDFFYTFNWNGSLTSLPLGSFDTSNITTAGEKFFGAFNSAGSLTKGNSQVQIKAVNAITNFAVGDQTDIAQGGIGYVNGT